MDHASTSRGWSIWFFVVYLLKAMLYSRSSMVGGMLVKTLSASKGSLIDYNNGERRIGAH
jgi:hypothetical protein